MAKSSEPAGRERAARGADGRDLEKSVAEACRRLGYEVKSLTRRDGRKIDVLARRPGGESRAEIVLECRDRAKPLSDQDVQDFVSVVDAARSGGGGIQAGVLVSRNGFTPDAKAVAYTREYVRLLTWEELARVGSARELEQGLLSADAELREAVMSYLERMLGELGREDWLARAYRAAAMPVPVFERPLQVRTLGGHGSEFRDADDVADSSRRLVILAGPGAGKTWLARRITRRAAEKALGALRSGARADDVELPLFVTCDEFKRHDSDRRDAAVNPSVDRFPPGTARSVDRLKKYLRDRKEKVLLVLDSLDEASAGGRDISQALISSWRVVLTSRHHSWHEGLWPGEAATVTVELLGLSYPSEVRDFAREWFKSVGGDGQVPPGAPGQEAETFMSRLARNPAARDLCTVPLFLTFLCMVGSGGGSDWDLPRTRTELLDQVVTRLLKSSWRGPCEGSRNDTALKEIAQEWAWNAAVNHSLSGLSEWPETFDVVSPGRGQAPDRDDLRCLDALIPPQSPPDADFPEDIARRGFVHRVVREHLVSGYVGTLPTDEAFKELLSHWWFDDTWENIIPSAIVKHGSRDELLSRLGKATATGKIRPGVRDVLSGASALNFLRVCAESRPEQWNSDNRARLHAAREQNATSMPTLVAGSHDWRDSNPRAVSALIAYLPDAGYATGEVAQALAGLATTPETRSAAVSALIAYLPDAGNRAGEVARALADLDSSDEAHAAAVSALIDRLPDAGYATGGMAQALAGLATTPETRAAAVSALIACLPTAGYATGEVAQALTGLDSSDETRAAAVSALIAYLPDAGYRTGEVTWALAGLATTPETRAAAVSAFIAYLPDAGNRAGEVARVLAGLAITPETRAAAVSALIDRLPTAGHATGEMAQALTGLDSSDEARAAAVSALIAYLPNAGDQTGEIARALVGLDSSDETRAAAVSALIALIAHLSFVGYRPGEVARALADLDSSDEAVSAFIAYLPDAGWRTGEVARALVSLDSSDEARAAAVSALIAYLANTAGNVTGGMARALADLATTPETRAAAVRALIACLPTAGHATGEVTRALADLDSSDEARAAAVSALIAYLPYAGYRTGEVGRALVGLDSSDETRAAAVSALIACPPNADNETGGMTSTLVGLATTPETRAAAVRALIARLPSAGDETGEVARALRRVCAFSQWWAQLSMHEQT
jgi:hypothetical protein